MFLNNTTSNLIPQKGSWLAVANGLEDNCPDKGLFSVISFSLFFFLVIGVIKQSQIDLIFSPNRGRKEVSFSVKILINRWWLLVVLSCKEPRADLSSMEKSVELNYLCLQWEQVWGVVVYVLSIFQFVIHDHDQMFIREKLGDQRGELVCVSSHTKHMSG